MKPFIQFALAVLIFGFLMAGNAYGEDEVYHCAETANIGFNYIKERDSYQSTKFIHQIFKIEINRAQNRILLIWPIKLHRQRESFICKTIIRPELYLCARWTNEYHFNFNTKNGRFVYSRNNGYVAGDGDSIAISYGKCDKF